MDINYLLKDVVTYDEYIAATQEVLNKCKNSKVNLNITTILTLKKIRSLEIEYFNKYDVSGAACVILERLLTIAPSKTWGVLAKELICLLQYWLDAIRTHLINHHSHWWTFLKLILTFIKEIRLKEPSIPNLLVELTSECLFELATAAKPDVFQQHEILHCLNMVCAESGRAVRFAMRTKFGDYFVKLATQMMTSGYIPGQYSVIECLMRWLVPRHEPTLRAAAADKWLGRDLCPPRARDLFLNSTWMNFFQDARDFLNALNEGNGLVTSVICRHLTVGKIVVINGTERQTTWLDFNTAGNTISVILDPKVLEVFGVAEHRACETLLIDREITETATLHREQLGLTISLDTTRAPYIRPTDINIGDERGVSIVVSSRTNLRTVDNALRNTFGDKYELRLDLDTYMSQSPQKSCKGKNYNSEEDSRFSHPAEVKRRKHRHSGYVVTSANPVATLTTSTASTSSLLQLRDKLAALPRHNFDKIPVSVCAEPQLSDVSELTERDERCSSTATTLKFQPYGVSCYRGFRPLEKKTSQSDGETVKPKPRGGRRVLSPEVRDDNATSLLLVATLGSADDSVINETVERLSKSKDFEDDNIVDLLVREALQAKPLCKGGLDSGDNTYEQKSQAKENREVIKNSLVEKENRTNIVTVKKKCTVVSKSTTDDESNTEVYETPTVVRPKKKLSINRFANTDTEQKQVFDVNTIEDFFSQHVAENKAGEIVISPSLAKKINETSSETSESFDDNYLVINEDVHTDIEQCIFNEIEIIDCLNDMVDKVCSDFQNCAQYLFKENNAMSVTNKTNENEESDIFKNQANVQKPLETSKSKRSTKKKYTVKKTTKKRVSKQTQNNKQYTVKKMSTIIEQPENDTLAVINQNISDSNTSMVKIPSPDQTKSVSAENMETPIVRRRRKLYSPKDDAIEDKIVLKTDEIVASDVDDVPLSEIKACINSRTPKTTATCYKELEKERKKYCRITRTRKSKGKTIETPSPRTLKMNTVFDNLKQTVDSSENIILVDKNTLNTDVYNFSSDSEDEDFKKKKIDVKKHASSSTLGSLASTTVKSRRNTRRGKYSETSNDENKSMIVKRKKVSKRLNKGITDKIDPVIELVGEYVELVDEKMRKAPREVLNTSIIHEYPTHLEAVEIEPILKEKPKMEEIVDNSESMNVLKSKQVKKGKDQFDANNYNLSNNPLPLQTVNKRPKRTPKVKIQDSEESSDAVPKKKVNKRARTAELLVIKKEKGLIEIQKQKMLLDGDDEGTISPLPGLLVESMPQCTEDVNDSFSIKMLQKFKRIYQEGPDTANDSVNTQNMLSDGERLNFGAPNYCITSEVDFVDDSKDNTEPTDNQNKGNKKVDKKQKQTIRNVPKTIKSGKKTVENNVMVSETIEISVDDKLYEKSIATDGITAHGEDLDEMPPNANTIQEELQPREILDLDESMKDYFKKLTQEINDCAKSPLESSKSTEGKEVSNIIRNQSESSRKSGLSPVVAVQRLSFEDISKWMPSRRTSASSSQSTHQTEHFKVKSPLKSTEDLKQSGPETSTPDSFKNKSPIIPLTRISFREFKKWLPLPQSIEDEIAPPQKVSSGGVKLVYRTRSKSKTKDFSETAQDFSNVNKTYRKSVRDQQAKTIGTKIEQKRCESKPCTRMRDKEEHTGTILVESESDLDGIRAANDYFDIKASNNRATVKTTGITKTRELNSESEENYNCKRRFEKSNTLKGASYKKFLEKTEGTAKNVKKQKCEIPIEFNNEDYESDVCKTKRPSKDSNKPSTREIGNIDSAIKAIDHRAKPVISPVRLFGEIATKPNHKKTDISTDCLTHIRDIFRSPKESQSAIPSLDDKSSVCVTESPIRKRQSYVPISSVPKKRRFEESKKEVVPCQDISSGPSISSVNEWFRRIKTDHRGQDASLSIRDTIQNIMEKLDTTLVEINQNTSKKLVNLFVEAQKTLEEHKNKRRTMYKQVAKELIGDMVRAIDEKFADLDRKSQAMDINYKEQLKKLAFDLIKEDCKQKRAMVQLLREDVQAVTDHIDRSRTTGSP